MYGIVSKYILLGYSLLLKYFIRETIRVKCPLLSNPFPSDSLKRLQGRNLLRLGPQLLHKLVTHKVGDCFNIKRFTGVIKSQNV